MRRDWEYKKLGEVVAPKNQIQRALKCFNKTDIIKYLDISSIDNSKYQISAYTEYALENAPSRAQQKVEINDIIISLVRPNLKNIARIEIKDHSLVASSGFCVLRTTELIDNNYLFYFISSQKYTDYLVGVTAGANYPAVKESDIRDSLIPIPPKSTQLAIVAELDKLNEMIRLKKQQLEDYDQLAQSIFYEMFGDPVENEKGWEVKKISEITSYYNGKAHEKNIDDLGKYTLINSKFISTDGKEFKKTNVQYFPLYKNDIVMVLSDIPKGKALGKCFLIRENDIYSLNQRICCFRGFKGDSVFLKYLINRHPYFLSYDDGKGQTNLRKNDVENCPVPLPPLPLQQQFAARIETIEQQKQQVKDTIKDLETLLASRMQYWFDFTPD